MKNKIFSGCWGKNHCQGATMDKEHKYVYYSFTTKLVKTDTEGNIIGTVDNITGHLGCIDFNDNDGKVYASLEYKNDKIGRGILKTLGLSDQNIEDGFYIAIFDVDKIDRLDMDAEKDGVMRTVYLKKVLEDFKGKVNINGKEIEHVHGCSGIDGLAIGRSFGENNKKDYLHVCYGVYSDLDRDDNDYQVILQYEIENLWEMGKTHSQSNMHRVGPDPVNEFFVYTGNTTYGVQNLEYDAFTGDYLITVYRGKKPQFPNFTNFVIDGSILPHEEELKGCNGERGKVLTLKKIGEEVNGISGINQFVNGNVEFGTMGIYSLGNGDFYVVDPVWDNPENLSVYLVLYRLKVDENGKWSFIEKK